LVATSFQFRLDLGVLTVSAFIVKSTFALHHFSESVNEASRYHHPYLCLVLEIAGSSQQKPVMKARLYSTGGHILRFLKVCLISISNAITTPASGDHGCLADL
jgi:hypothetical protein